MSVRVVDTRERAKKAYRRFYDRAPEKEREMPFGWPEVMQEVGTGGAEMYRSNKWKKTRGETEDYKHVPHLEGGTRLVYVEPGFLRTWGSPRRPLQVVGPLVQLEEPMPRHFTQLGPLLGIQMRLYEPDGTGGFRVPTERDRGCVEVTVARGMLGAAEHPETKETLLFVYTEEGVHMVLTGPSLAIEKDGIVG